MPPLTAGEKAPNFRAAINGGANISLEDYRGQHVVLYFYPKDDTPGCTKEACGFRDALADLLGKRAVVLGVSPDSVKAHDKFVKKYSLPFALVADAEHRIAESYGVWGEKVFMGRRYEGVHRVTFLIGPDGVIQRVWEKVKPEGHAEEVLAALPMS